MNQACFQRHTFQRNWVISLWARFNIGKYGTFVTALQRSSVVVCPFTDFEKWLIDIGKQKKLLSKSYNLLLSLKRVTDKAQRQLMLDLNIGIAKQVWEEMCTFNHTFSLNVAIRENRYKILHRWYLTPFQLSLMYPEVNKCWKCGHLKASYLHVSWDCGRINTFWCSI